MAFPTVATSATLGSGNATIPARNAGDVLVLVQELYNGTGSKNLTIGAVDGVAWALVGSVAGTTSSTEYLVVYYLVVGTTGSATSVTVSNAGGWSIDNCSVLVIRGADPGTAVEGAFTTGVNPGSLNPAGWGTEDTLWIAACGRFTGAPTVDPTSYTNVTNDSFLRVSKRALNAASEDPAAFSGGSGSGSVATIAIRPLSNTAPTANAGTDQSVNVGATVHLDGTLSSDVESSITYAWTVTNAGGTSLTTASLTGASTSTPTFTAPVPGSGDSAVITLTLTVTDTGGLTGTDTVAITTNVVVLVAKTGAGGPLVGGTADLFTSPAHLFTGSGGLLAGGAASGTFPSVLGSFTGAGGPLMGGAADILSLAAHLFTGAGGLVAGGTADLFTAPPTFVTGSGGLSVGTRSDGFATVPEQITVGGSRRFAFRYELLDSSNNKIGDLTAVESCTIEQNWLADIKRTAKFRLRDTGDIDFLSNRIKPYVQLRLPPYGPDDWVEWPQGVFLLSSPQRTADATGTRWRDVDAYDATQVYTDDLVDARYTVASGTKYTDAVSTLLGSVPKNITTSASTLPTAREWDPGTSKLKIINELLGSVNYESLSFDEDGIAIVRPYRAPSTRPAEYTYADDDLSVMLPEVVQDLDLFAIPNKWVLVVSEPDRAALSSTYTNTNPASPTSTVRRGRTIVDFRTEQDAADQGALDALVSRLAFEASQVYEAIEFETGIMPIHSGNDVYRIEFGLLAVAANYSEHTWSMELTVTATMKHNARRVVDVG